MNVASKELCKELYDLSSWDDTCWMYGAKGLKPRTVMFGSKPTPAYDLGYLLRKLQVAFGVSIKYVDPDNPTATDLADWHGRWVCYTPWLKQKHYAYAVTPEDAAAKLAIEFFKQGVLENDVTPTPTR